MPSFNFAPYHSPFANSIAEMMLRQGDIAAHHAEQLGAIQARAQEQIGAAQAQGAQQSGQAWAHGLMGAGQAVGGAIEQAADPRRQMEQMQVGQAKQLQRGQGAVDTMMRGDQLASGDTGPRQDSYLDANGLFDIGKMTQALGQSGVGHLAPDLLRGAEQINKSITDHAAAEQQAGQAKTLMFGDMADGALKLAKIGMPIPAAMDFVVQPGLATKRIQPQEYAQLKAQILALPPEQQAAALKTFMDAASQLGGNKTLAEGAQEVDRYGRVVAKGGEKPPNQAELAVKAAQGDPDAIKAMSLLKPTPQKSLEAKEGFVIKGTTNVPTFNPADGSWSFAGKPVPADQVQRAAPPKDPMAQALQSVALQTAQLNLTDKKRRDANIAAVAQGMKDGTIPPDPEGLTRQGLYADVVGQLQKEGVNFSTLRQNYLAQKRLIQTENSPQGVRLDIAVRSGLAMYDKVDAISSQWDGLGLGALSRANLKLASEGYKGPAAQKLAVELNGQIAQLTSDVATVEQNGLTPTNEARKVAEESMKSWWGDGTIKAMTAQGRANLRIRDTARKETAPLVPGQTPATPPAASGPAIGARGMIKGQLVEWDGKGWKAVK